MNKWKYCYLYLKNLVERAVGVEDCKIASYKKHCEMEVYFADKYLEYSEYSNKELKQLQQESENEIDIIIMEIVLSDRIEEVDSSVLVG